MEVRVYTIEDKEYILMNELDNNGIHYLLLVNPEDEEDMMFRKEDGDRLLSLDNDEEFYRVLQLFDEIS